MNLNTSIIVITYNCEGYILKFLSELTSSLREFKNFEVLINDNNSSDNTFKIIEENCKNLEANYIFSQSENVGFAKANNEAIRICKFEHILLLNPDVFGFDHKFWENLIIKRDENNPLFIKLLNSDLSIQENVSDELSIKRRFKRVLNLSTNKSQSSKRIFVETGIMAFVVIPKSCFEKVGLLSEKYFMYAEDHDWFYRARRHGYKMIFEPSLYLIHTGGGSAVSVWNNLELKKIKLKVERLFIQEHFKGLNRMLLLIINRIQTFLNTN